MPTIKAVAYNTGSPIANTTQYGNIAVGTGNQDYSGLGGLQWWASTDLDVGYAIVAPNPAGNTPNPLSIPCYLSFWKTNGFSDPDFINVASQATGQSFSTKSQAQNYLNNNGYWTSYTGGCITYSTTDLRWVTNPVSAAGMPGSYGWNRNNSTATSVTIIRLQVSQLNDDGGNVPYDQTEFLNSLVNGDVIKIFNYPNPATGYAEYTITGKTYNPVLGNPVYIFDVTYKTASNYDNGQSSDAPTGRKISFLNSSGTLYSSFTTCY